MNQKKVRLSDHAQDVFVDAVAIDGKIIRLDISEAYNDSSTEISVDRATLLNWCRELIVAFDNEAEPAPDTSVDK